MNREGKILDERGRRECVNRFQKLIYSDLKGRIPQDFMEWLEDSDFYHAPASTRFHGNYPGGLVEHSLHVFDRLMGISLYEPQLKKCGSSLTLVSLFHDLCKVGCYQREEIHTADSAGNRTVTTSYKFHTDFPFGHGEKSVHLLVSHGVRLTTEEMLAIRWHMGPWSGERDDRDMKAAMERFPLVLALQQADMQATYWDE